MKTLAKFIPGYEGMEPDQEVEIEKVEYTESPGFSLDQPVPMARRLAVEKKLRLCWLRYRFGKWDGKPRKIDETVEEYEAKLVAADAEWERVQNSVAGRWFKIVQEQPPTDNERRAVEDALGKINKQAVVEGVPTLAQEAGGIPRILEWEAHAILPGYNYRKTASVIDGSVLQGTSSQLKGPPQRKPSALLKKEYDEQFFPGEALPGDGYTLALAAWQAAQKTGIIDVVCNTKQTQDDITDIETVRKNKAEQLALRNNAKGKKAFESARAAAASVAGDVAHDEIRAIGEKTVRDGESAAEEFGNKAKKAKKDALTAEQKADQKAEKAAKEKAERLEQQTKNFIKRSILGPMITRIEREAAKEEAKNEKDRINLELEAYRGRQLEYQNQKNEMYRLQGAWDESDLNAYAHRQGMLNRMSELRVMWENLAQWTQECNDAWAKADRMDQDEHEKRVEWFNDNVKKAADGASELVPPVPRSLYTFYDPYVQTRLENNGKVPQAMRLEAEPLNVKPHWFDAMAVSAQVAKFAWTSAQSGVEPSTDNTTSRSRAVGAMYGAIMDTKKQWKPAQVDVGTSVKRSIDVSFDWDSRGYSERIAKDGELRDPGQHGTLETLQAAKYRDTAGNLDFKSVTYINELPEEYYQIDQVEEEEDDEYGHIPENEVKKYLNAKGVNQETQRALKKTNADRLREDIVADNLKEMNENPKRKKLTENQVVTLMIQRAREELYESGKFPRDMEEEEKFEGGTVTGVNGEQIRARSGTMYAMRQQSDGGGNLRWDENGQPVWELGDDPFIVADDDEDIDGEEAEKKAFLDRTAIVDGGHRVPAELLNLFPPEVSEKFEYRWGPTTDPLNPEGYGNYVTQPMPIPKPDGGGYYTNEEWLALQEAASEKITYEQAIDNARRRRRGVAVPGKRKRIIDLPDAGKLMATDTGAFIRQSKVTRYLRELSNSDAAKTSQTNKERIEAQLRATDNVNDKMSLKVIKDLIDVQARKEMAGQVGYESDDSKDSAYNSEGELDEDDRFGEASVQSGDDEVQSMDWTDDRGAAGVEGMDEFLMDDSSPSSPEAPPPVPSPVASPVAPVQAQFSRMAVDRKVSTAGVRKLWSSHWSQR